MEARGPYPLQHFRKRDLMIAVLLVLSCFFRIYYLNSPDSSSQRALWYIRYSIQLGLIFYWMVTIYYRILQPGVRKNLLWVGGLEFFLLLDRFIKWEFMELYSLGSQITWYLYYLPLIMIPTLLVFIVGYIGKPEEYVLPQRWKILYIPALFFLFMVFTNDLHQLVFRFSGTMSDRAEYHYGPGYNLLFAFLGGEALYALIVLLVKCQGPKRRLRSLPLLVLFATILYNVLYAFRLVNGDFVALECLFITLALESAIRVGLIRSNSCYRMLFEQADIHAQIVDEDYRLFQKSQNAIEFSESLMRQAEDAPVEMGTWRLCSARITGGHVLWQQDMEEIQMLIGRLKTSQNKLKRNNLLLRRGLDIKEQRARIREKERLYNTLSKEGATQRARLETLLARESFLKGDRSTIWEICVLAAFLKRRGNLLLMMANAAEIDGTELLYCIRESLDYIKLQTELTSADAKITGKVQAQDAIRVYDLFEAVCEKNFTALTAVMTHLYIQNGGIRLRMQLGLMGDF